MLKEVIKRDGRIVEFSPARIESALKKAFVSIEKRDDAQAIKGLLQRIIFCLQQKETSRIHVEEIQDVVEEVLMESGFKKIARAYILYREKRRELREGKEILGVRDDLKLSFNALRVLQKRYLRKDEKGKIVETPSQMFERVARTIAEAEKEYGEDVGKREKIFFELMRNLEFLPNSPTLMNAGTPLGQLSACFVIPIEDSMEGIFRALHHMALIHQSGGGTGFSFSALRPRGDVVQSTGGIASGPVSFMKIFDTATQVIKQGGRRRGANMGILSVHHPDILEFITTKDTPGVLENFNISVAVTDQFMEAVKQDKDYPLVNPRTGKEVRRLKAREVINLISYHAWKNGDPGVVWIDEINRYNPTPHLGRIEATNPCAEQPLLPYESCNLGSINLSRLCKEGKIDWERMEQVVEIAVRFLDDVIEVNKFPIPEVGKMTRANRKIGLGVMGFADLLIKLNIPYNTEEAEKIAGEIMHFIHKIAVRTSAKLAEKRGNFPSFPGSIWNKKGFKYMRNATLTTIAPTGTLSIIAGTTSGIEPLFAIAYTREVMEGSKLLEVNQDFLHIAREKGFYSREIIEEASRTGSLKNIKGIPESVKKLFVTSFDIPPAWHIRIQAAFQKHTDNAVSKTINFPQEATPAEIRESFYLAYKRKCRGLTVYRYGSKKTQVLYRGAPLERDFLRVGPEFTGECRVCEV
ncbi:MAG: adenosylcobalamin-dependent ribonucleoside-diphosphate reductase [Caldiserica bacterium]|nr:adenosylcobalamin-dependent ribonucleoside-diphosphate reductase [Caldisericota bacterium]